MFTGSNLRDIGRQKVLESAALWSINTAEKLEHWLKFITQHQKSRFFTGDDIRNHLIAIHTPEPHHPNAWSAIIGAAVKRWQKDNKIVHVGYDLSKRPSRHSAIIRIYKII